MPFNNSYRGTYLGTYWGAFIRIYISILLTISACLFPHLSLLAATFEEPNIDLIYINEKIPVPGIPEQHLFDTWQHSCKILASKLKDGKGPYNVGIFKSTNCLTTLTDKDDSWAAIFTQEKDQIQVKLLDPNNTMFDKFSIPAGDYGPLVIKHTIIADLIALKLSDALPMTGILNTQFLVQGKQLPIRLPKTKILDTHPYSNIKIFSVLKRKSNIFITKLVASGALNEATTSSTHYQLTDESPDGISYKKHYFQHAEGPNTNSALISVALVAQCQELVQKLKNGFFETFTSALWPKPYRGFTGGALNLAVGKQVFPSKEPLQKSSIIAFATKIEHSSLGGYGYSFKSVPNQQSTETAPDGNKTDISWSRHHLSAIWNWDLESLANQFELSPKFGICKAKARLLTNQTTESEESAAGSTVAYHIRHAYSIAFESSIKWKMRHSQFKIFHEFATSLNFSSNSASQGVYSNDIGMELLLLTGPEFKLFQSDAKLAVSLFSNIHLLAFSGGQTDNEEAITTTLSGGFAGVGTSIYW